jgi:cardiolipin synthase
MATRMKAILIGRARAGVRVLFLYDAFGGEGLPRSYLDSLSAAHITVASFRPVRWYSIDKAQTRSHVRAVVVDGYVGYTGGFGLDDKWYGDGRHANQWRESNVRFTGPAVLQLQAAFAAGWAEATGELLTGDLFFPESPAPAAPRGAPVAGLLYTTPTMGSTPAQRFLALSIAGARHHLYITNSYFVPDDGFRDLLKRAAARGVDVRILTVGSNTDVKTARYAGRHRYEELLRAGIRIYEYQAGMMHAKSLVADGLWSTVGSMNFDNRSLTFNDESNFMALDPVFGATLDSVFVRDLRYARPITLEAFRRRPAIDHVLEAGANVLSRLL